MPNPTSPVGTIIATFLSWKSFEIASANGVWNASSSKWCLADGRDITGSELGSLLAGETPHRPQNAPDLRGIFLRGIDFTDPPVTSNLSGKDRMRPIGDYRDDVFQIHSHWLTSDLTPPGSIEVNTFAYSPLVTSGYDLSHTGAYFEQDKISVSVPRNSDPGNPARADLETAPKNISVLYVVRINS